MIQIYSLFDPLIVFSPYKGKTAVDIGCGTGDTVLWLSEQGCHAVGIDGLEMIKKARAETQVSQGSLLAGTGAILPFNENFADLVFFNASLHHIPEALMFDALMESSRILKKEGKIAVIEPLVSSSYYQITRLAEEETEIRKKAQEALVRSNEAGLSLELKMNFYIERSWEDYIHMTDHYFNGSDQEKSQVLKKAKDVLMELSQEAGCDPDQFRFQSACSMVVLGKG